MRLQRMTRRIPIVLALALVAGALAACAPYPDLQPYAAAEASLPPPAPGMARIYFYRTLDYYGISTGTTVYLNHQPVGFSRIGTVFYRDVAPGRYFISVYSPGPFPNQFKTVQLAPGQILYARIESLRSWSYTGPIGTSRGPTYVVALVGPQTARADMSALYYVPAG
jgi:hypothetical protein